MLDGTLSDVADMFQAGVIACIDGTKSIFSLKISDVCDCRLMFSFPLYM